MNKREEQAFFWRVYNNLVQMRSMRRVVVILVLILSVILLAWGLWPLEEVRVILPISPLEMQLPTPEGYIPVLIRIVES